MQKGGGERAGDRRRGGEGELGGGKPARENEGGGRDMDTGLS